MIKDDEEFYSLLSRRNSGKVTCGFEDRKNIEDEELKEVFLKRMGHNPKKASPKKINECQRSTTFPVLVYERLNSEGRYGG
jgi:hypothetical protein